mmetsp:Transcript_45833/g.178151  ORF Transcript_45833/g.178151 Transcript_45833/m.178151 type:complete len:90 (+) Transcript_45833:376-645(+)
MRCQSLPRAQAKGRTERRLWKRRPLNWSEQIAVGTDGIQLNPLAKCQALGIDEAMGRALLASLPVSRNRISPSTPAPMTCFKQGRESYY